MFEVGMVLTIRCESWRRGTRTAFGGSVESAGSASRRLRLLPLSERWYPVPLPLQISIGGPGMSCYFTPIVKSARNLRFCPGTGYNITRQPRQRICRRPTAQYHGAIPLQSS